MEIKRQTGKIHNITWLRDLSLGTLHYSAPSDIRGQFRHQRLVFSSGTVHGHGQGLFPRPSQRRTAREGRRHGRQVDPFGWGPGNEHLIPHSIYPRKGWVEEIVLREGKPMRVLIWLHLWKSLEGKRSLSARPSANVSPRTR